MEVEAPRVLIGLHQVQVTVDAMEKAMVKKLHSVENFRS